MDVSRPERAELEAVAAVLGEAFQDDPVVVAMIGASPGRLDRATHLYAALLAAQPDGGIVVDVVRDDARAILGVAVWEPPGADGAGLVRLVAQLPRFVRAIGLRGIPGALRGWSTLSRNRPQAPHWYLGEIGVTAAARGAGVGSRLLAHRLREVDEAGDAAYLESSTPRNRALYVRHGFEPGNEIHGIGAARPVAMWRAPSSARLPDLAERALRNTAVL